MRLIACHIENFGKLSDFSYAFTDGCNVICEENGWGKSTFAAFLRVMLYGFRNESKRDPLENERKRYTPWQKGVYGGELQFETDGRRYSVRRVFGSKSAEDEFVLTDLETHLPSTDFTEALGEELFQIDAASFERTVFLSQNDCETVITDSINAKMGNLAENTDDINNFETASKRLTDLLNAMSPTRKTGSIRRDRDQLTQLKTQIHNGQEIRGTMESIEARKRESLSARELLAKELSEMQKKQQELGVYKDQQAKKEKYYHLREQYAERQSVLKEAEGKFNGVIPTEEELKEQTAHCSDGIRFRKAMEIYSLTEVEREQLRENVPEVDAGALEERFAEAKELEQLKKRRSEEGLSGEESRRLKELAETFIDGMPEEEELLRIRREGTEQTEKRNRLQADELQCRTLESLQAQEMARLEREQEKQKKRKHLLIVLGAVLLLGGIAVLFLQPIVGGVLLAAGALLLVAAFLTGTGREPAPENTELTHLREEQMQLKEELRKIEADMDAFRSRWGIRESADLTLQLAELQNKCRDYAMLSERAERFEADGTTERIRNLEAGLREFLAEYGQAVAEGDYASALHTLAARNGRRQALLEKQRQYEQEKSRYEAVEAAVKKYILSLQLIPEERLEEQLTELENHRKDYQSALREFERSKAELAQFEETEDIPRLVSLREPEEGDSLENLAEEMQVTTERMEELFRNCNSYQDQLDRLQEAWDQIAGMEEESESLQEKIQEDKRKYELLGLTRDLLEQAKSSFTARYTEPVMRGFSKYYRMLTGRESSAYQMDANTKLKVVEGNLPREIATQSLGNRDLIGICMRMALVEAMYGAELPFLILDDPFVNLDEQRTKGAMEFLHSIAEEYQVIYFTCHNSRVAIQNL